MSIIILGNGLVSNSLSQLKSECDIVFFASGVSNSRETSLASFQRERAMLVSALQRYPNHRFIYFSSTIASIPFVTTPYSSHKRAMEKLLLAADANHLIVRLPQLVGPTKSPTLVAFLRSQILSGSTVTLQARATRRLLCHTDLKRFVDLFLHMKTLPAIVTVAPKFTVSPFEVSCYIADYYGISNFRYKFVDSGYEDIADISFIESICGRDDELLSLNYWKTVLSRNLPLLSASPFGMPEQSQ